MESEDKSEGEDEGSRAKTVNYSDWVFSSSFGEFVCKLKFVCFNGTTCAGLNYEVRLKWKKM